MNLRRETWWQRLVRHVESTSIAGVYPNQPRCEIVEASLATIIKVIGGRERTMRWLRGRSMRVPGNRRRWRVMATRGLFPDEIRVIARAVYNRQSYARRSNLVLDRKQTPLFTFLRKTT